MLFVIRVGEMFLKSSHVHNQMEKQLLHNVKRSMKLKKIKANVRRARGRLWLECTSNDAKKVREVLKHIFGIYSFSSVTTIPVDMKAIEKEAVSQAKRWKGSFAIDVKRVNKSFPYKSQDAECIIGKAIAGKRLKVNLRNPDNILNIDIDNKCYIYSSTERGPGGLPLHYGAIVAELKSDRDALAAWLIMHRGFLPYFPKAKKNVLKKLERWFNSLQPRLVVNHPESIKAVLTPETNIKKLSKMKKEAIRKKKMLLTPLVGFSDDEIKKRLDSIF